jgi:hypothetical protein
VSCGFERDQAVISGSSENTGTSETLEQADAVGIGEPQRRCVEPAGEHARGVGGSDGEPGGQAREDRIRLEDHMGRQNGDGRERFGRGLVQLVPSGQRGDDGARVGGQRRPRSMSPRTCAALNGWLASAANLTPCGPSSTCTRDGIVTSRRPSTADNSSSAPGANPSSSRNGFGTTKRPAASMVVRMV